MLDTKDQQIAQLKSRISVLEAQVRKLGQEPQATDELLHDSELSLKPSCVPETRPLKLDEYVRYGRQMILPGFGLPSQLALGRSSVLVIGAGGLGCPALMYLASAGVGKLTIVDHDTVELSNLHRQVLHNVDSIGAAKVESARQALLRINPSIEIRTHQIPLDSYTLSSVFTPETKYDAVLDCTDTPSTRYLISDITARLGIPLISGAAQRTDGQLVVYNLPTRQSQGSESVSYGPCMRCVFPSVSRTGAGVERCSDVGVLGPVVGVIGVLMALEALKVLTGFGLDECESHKPSMLLYSALSPRPFKTIKLRPRQVGCRGCAGSPTNGHVLSDVLADIKPLEDDYAGFCGDLEEPSNPLDTGMRSGKSRVNAQELQRTLASAFGTPEPPITIIDTRPPTEFGICSIPESINVPLAQLLKKPANYLPSSPSRTFVVCRLGNDSQVAVRALREVQVAPQAGGEVVDVIGGLRAWAREVDPSFPVY